MFILCEAPQTHTLAQTAITSHNPPLPVLCQPSSVTHTHTQLPASSEPARSSCELHRRGFFFCFLGGRIWAAGSERQPWFTGQACSFTREISRATINTTVSFKGAVYHTTGFEGPQTDLVFVVFFFFCSPPPLLFP